MNTLLLYSQRTNNIPDEMHWKDAAIHQECFIRDIICFNLLNVPVFKIGEHTSKSINLPVYGFIMRNDIKIIASYNFHCWVISIELPEALTTKYLDKSLFTAGVDKPVQFCYGFKDEWIYGCYNSIDPECTKFTVELDNEYQVYTLMFLLNKAFTDTFYYNDKKRTVKEIAESIEEIYKANGFYEYYDASKELGLSKPTMRKYMSGWEILWNSYYILSNDKNISYNDKDAIINDPEKFAEYIVNSDNPKIEETFLMEEHCFKTKF